MSVDYRAEYGIGYEVCESDELLENEEALEDGLNEYIENNIGEGFSVFETNQGYDSCEKKVFVVADNPFENGGDLTDVKERLDAEIERLNLECYAGFDLVGGLYIY